MSSQENISDQKHRELCQAIGEIAAATRKLNFPEEIKVSAAAPVVNIDISGLIEELRILNSNLMAVINLFAAAQKAVPPPKLTSLPEAKPMMEPPRKKVLGIF
jgi:hypothetical protein